MLEKIKLSLRISTNHFDGELTDLISACKVDLGISGVEKIIDTDPLILRAITVYCKANFGLDNPDSEKLQQSYNMLKCHLALAGDYKNVVP